MEVKEKNFISKNTLKFSKIKIKEYEIIYEKLLIIGDNNVGKSSLIQNIFSQENNPDDKENDEKENKEEEQKTEEKKEDNEIKIKDKDKESNNNNENTNDIKNERKENDLNDINNNNKKEGKLIYEKKLTMNNSNIKIKDFQLIVTSFCDKDLIHSLAYRCQCILILFESKNKISFEKIKNIIYMIKSELKANKYNIILVSTKNDQDSKNKEEQNILINNEEIESFIKEINDNDNNEIIINKYIEISNNTKRGINNLRNEVINSYKENILSEKPLTLELSSDFMKSQNDDIYYKFNNKITIKENNDNITEIKSPKYIFKLSNMQSISNKDIYESIKIILIGDSLVGKTSFLNQFFGEGFNPNLTSTIGINEHSKILKYKNEIYKIQIWDTAGQERFKSIPKQYYEKIEGVFLFYDITNEQSFDNTIKWLKDIYEGGHKNIIVYLLGNKVDLIDQRKVKFNDGYNFAKEKNIKFMEISCKLNLNISDVVYFMVYDILKIEHNNDIRNKSFFIDKKSQNISRNLYNNNESNEINSTNIRNNNNINERCCF